MDVTNVVTILANASHTDQPDQSFDLAFVFGFARPIGNMEDVWIERHRLLKPGGILAVEGRLRPRPSFFNRWNAKVGLASSARLDRAACAIPQHAQAILETGPMVDTIG